MESLFKRHAPRRGRVFVMLAGSLLIHGGLVGIGALLVQPEPAEVVVDWPLPEGEGPTPFKRDDIPVEQPTVENVPTATPDTVQTVEATPPPVEADPEFSEAATPTPRQKPAVKLAVSARTATPRATNTTVITPGSGRPGAGGSGLPSSASLWVTPHPPYPAAARGLSNGGGLTTVRVSTDAMGHISNVVVVRSAGNPLLDAHTVSYVREHWRGPANASRTTEFLYQLR